MVEHDQAHGQGEEHQHPRAEAAVAGQGEREEGGGHEHGGQVEHPQRQGHAGERPGPGDAAAPGQLAAPEDGPHAARHVLAQLADVVPGDGAADPGLGAQGPHDVLPAPADAGHAQDGAHAGQAEPGPVGVGDVGLDLGPVLDEPPDHEEHRGAAEDQAERGDQLGGAPGLALGGTAVAAVAVLERLDDQLLDHLGGGDVLGLLDGRLAEALAGHVAGHLTGRVVDGLVGGHAASSASGRSVRRRSSTSSTVEPRAPRPRTRRWPPRPRRANRSTPGWPGTGP